MRYSIFLSLLLFSLGSSAQERWRVSKSLVSFVSDAPLERIVADNTRSSGIIELETRSFAVQIPVAEFQGFNGPLQREHFNENYMATKVFPNATFVGRIIESLDLKVPGSQEIRAKGKLSIHGVEQERIIPCKVVVAENGVRITTMFDVAVDDHGIRVPRIVQQKIAAVIEVKVDLLFEPPSSSP